MKITIRKFLALTAFAFCSQSGFAANVSPLTVTLPEPSVYYTALANLSQPNYVITNLSFGAGIVRYYPGGDVNADLKPYLDISAQDSFTYDAKSCISRNPCTYFTGTGGDAATSSNYPNVFSPGDTLDAKYQFTLYQPEKVSFSVLANGLNGYNLQLTDAANNPVAADSQGSYVLSNSTYNLEFSSAFNLLTDSAQITGTGIIPPVPELDTWAMLLGGLGFVGLITRRNQKES